MGVEYRSNLENVMKVCMKAMKKTEGVLIEPQPAVLVSEFGDSSITLTLRAWVNSKDGWVKIRSDFMKNLKVMFNEHNITIPWPIRTIVQDKEQNYTEKTFSEEVEKESKTPQVTATMQVQPEAVPVKADDDEQSPLMPLGEKNL